MGALDLSASFTSTVKPRWERKALAAAYLSTSGVAAPPTPTV